MGRKIHCSEDMRLLIQNLRKKGKSLRNIADTIGCSLGMVQNALKQKKITENRGRPRKTTLKLDRRIIKEAKRDPFATSTQILFETKADVSSRTIRRRLVEGKLPARSPRKVPLLSKRNIKQRKEFARSHLNWYGDDGIKKWRNILWSDESKFNLFNSDGRQTVRRPANKSFDPRYTKKTVKHGGGNIMVWGSFSWYGIGPIHLIEGIMTSETYRNILENVLIPYSDENMPLIWIFQQDNDPKHTAKKTKEYFLNKQIKTLPWPAQSPDLNPIENLWKIVKNSIAHKRPRNKAELWNFVKAAWEAIPTKTCQDLVNSMPRRCQQVLKNKGNATKY